MIRNLSKTQKNLRGIKLASAGAKGHGSLNWAADIFLDGSMKLRIVAWAICGYVLVAPEPRNGLATWCWDISYLNSPARRMYGCGGRLSTCGNQGPKSRFSRRDGRRNGIARGTPSRSWRRKIRCTCGRGDLWIGSGR